MKDKTLLDEFAIMVMENLQIYTSPEERAIIGYEHAKKIMKIRDNYLAEFLNEGYPGLGGNPLGGDVAKELKPEWLLKLESVAGVSQGYCENTVLPQKARWAAVDSDGSLYFYQYEPEYYERDKQWDSVRDDPYKIDNIDFPTIKPDTAQYCLVVIE